MAELLNPSALAIVLFVLCIIQFGFIIYLAGRKKKTKLVAEKHYISLHNSYDIVKNQLAYCHKENSEMQSKMEALAKQISDLEEINSNLTEQKGKLIESKNQLEVLHRKKEELFAIAIHDIKNPASAIKGYIELINNFDISAQEQQELMVSLLQSSEQLMQLAQQVSKSFAEESIEEQKKYQPASIKDIIDSVCSMNQPYAKKKGIKLINKSSSSLPQINADIIKIEEVLENLINNALKYSSHDTMVQVLTYFNSDVLTVEVSDNGPGLSDEDLTRVFSKGAVLSTQPTGGESRSGLGLWIVKTIIEDHNGRVWVKSKKGRGSTFAFELPVLK